MLFGGAGKSEKIDAAGFAPLSRRGPWEKGGKDRKNRFGQGLKRFFSGLRLPKIWDRIDIDIFDPPTVMRPTAFIQPYIPHRVS